MSEAAGRLAAREGGSGTSNEGLLCSNTSDERTSCGAPPTATADRPSASSCKACSRSGRDAGVLSCTLTDDGTDDTVLLQKVHSCVHTKFEQGLLEIRMTDNSWGCVIQRNSVASSGMVGVKASHSGTKHLTEYCTQSVCTVGAAVSFTI